MLCRIVGCARKAGKNGLCERHSALPGVLKTGYYSRRLPKGLAEKLGELEDEELCLEPELAVLRALAAERMEAMREGGEQAALDALEKAERCAEKGDLEGVLKACAEARTKAAKSQAARAELRAVLGEIRDMARAEAQIRYGRESAMSLKEAEAFVALVVTLLQKHVGAKEVFDAIRNELVGYIDKASGGRLGDGRQGLPEGEARRPVHSDEGQTA